MDPSSARSGRLCCLTVSLGGREVPVTHAGPVVGMVGGGQLARMTYQASIALGIGFRLLAERPDDSAAQVVSDVAVGDHHDLDTLRRFARTCDVLTFDHEHVPPG